MLTKIITLTLVASTMLTATAQAKTGTVSPVKDKGAGSAIRTCTNQARAHIALPGYTLPCNARGGKAKIDHQIRKPVTR